jgi:uncharacterized membrane protein YebE (DUF533 family)
VFFAPRADPAAWGGAAPYQDGGGVDAETILDGLLRGALGGRRKRSRRARRALGRRGSLINATTLLAAAGVAWGVYETWQGQRSRTVPARPTPGSGSTPPPLPAGPGAAAPPPLPTSATGLPEPVLRVVRLMISAAGADGHLSPEEREAILAEARKVEAEDAVARELASPRPLAEIVSGVTDPKLREDLYTLAFGIVRADETVSGAERIYLAQLAHRLELEPDAVARLESEAASRIDEESAVPDGSA